MSEQRMSISRRNIVVGGAAVCCVGMTGCGADNTPKAKAVDFLIDSAKVPVGSGYIDKANSVVITQLKKGEFKAFSSICTHEGCQVGSVTSTTISCPCHGSQFSASTGEVTAPPANKPLPEKKVTVQGSQLHITG